jgi:hypothetical protein
MANEDVVSLINDFQSRWVGILTDMSKEAIPSGEFNSILVMIRLEISEIKAFDYIENGEPNKFGNFWLRQTALNTVMSNFFKARAIASSRWQDKHPGFWSKQSAIVDLGFLKAGDLHGKQ